MANARIQAAIRTARTILKGAQQQNVQVTVIGSNDDDPEPDELFRQWVIQYDGVTAPDYDWRKSLMDESD